MHLQEIEYVTNIVLRFFKNHPELCPHDFSWSSSKPSEIEGKREHRYVCELCGREDIRIEDE